MIIGALTAAAYTAISPTHIAYARHLEDITRPLNEQILDSRPSIFHPHNNGGEALTNDDTRVCPVLSLNNLQENVPQTAIWNLSPVDVGNIQTQFSGVLERDNINVNQQVPIYIVSPEGECPNYLGNQVEQVLRERPSEVALVIARTGLTHNSADLSALMILPQDSISSPPFPLPTVPISNSVAISDLFDISLTRSQSSNLEN